MIRFAVCDSEQKMIESIINKLNKYFTSESNIKAYSDEASLLADHQQDRFDAIFLGVDIPGLNGMKIAEKIREDDRRVKIIFVSGQLELAYKGYFFDAFRFVRKSNFDEDLREASTSLNRVLCFQNEPLEFKTDNGDFSIVARNIKYFEAEGHFINMTCSEGTIRTHGTLKDYEARLNNIGFIRVHKGYLANFRYISSMDNKTVTLTCGTRLPLSRKRIENTKTQISFFKSFNDIIRAPEFN